MKSDITVVKTSVSLGEIKTLAKQRFGDMVKGVVDIKSGIMALGAELHADEEALLLEQGSKQQDLWGINLYPDEFGSEDWIEFDSMINIRPSQGNRSRSVEDPKIQRAITSVVNDLVKES